MKIIRKLKELKDKRINSDYFNLFKEAYLLIKLNLKKNKRIKIKNNGSILVINPCLIGEFVVSLHALKHFIDKNGGDIDLIVSHQVESLAKKIKGVRKVFTVESVYGREIEKIKKNKPKMDNYDFILVMRLSEEVYKILKNIKYNKMKTSMGPYLRYGIYLLRNISNKRIKKQWYDVNFEITGENKLREKRVKFEDLFKFNKTDLESINKIPFLRCNKKKKIIIIHTGSDWKIKLWDNKNWIELVRKINKFGNFLFVFIGGTNEEGTHFNEIKKELDFKVYSVIKKLNLKETVLFMKRCDLFIGVDSGPRNIAHLIDLPSICLLGPGPKHYRPVSKKAIVIDKSNCKCVSLFCYRKKTCIEKISVNYVFKKFKKIYYKK